MNNSFEQGLKKGTNSKQLFSKNGIHGLGNFKKEVKGNNGSKSKYEFVSNNQQSSQSKYQNEPYQFAGVGNGSIEKNLGKTNGSKSNHKKSRRDETANRKSKDGFLKKCPTLQLTKKQRQIRQAIQYRFEKSRMRNYRFCCVDMRMEELDDQRAREIIDQEEEDRFVEEFGYLSEIKAVNLWDYHRCKEQNLVPKREKSNNKIIVIKNSKKKRQNSDTTISFTNKEEELKLAKNLNKKLVLNAGTNQYFSNNPIQSQRTHTDTSTSYQRENHSNQIKLQFPSSKGFHKPKNGSRSKIKTEHSVGLNDKMNASSSVQRNFKSIKDIYLNAITNLASKNTVKSNNKLFKGESDIKNKGSKSMLYESQKKPYKHEYSSSRPDKTSSSSALQQNYFSCISSRQNKKDQKATYNRKTTKQKLDKTLLINEVNPTQWKSIIMKIDDSRKMDEPQSRKFKLKFKQHGDKYKSCMNTSHGKFMAHPHSYRQNTKSPKFKKFIINDNEDVFVPSKSHGKNVSSVKNLNNQTYQSLLYSSAASINEEVPGIIRKNRK